MAVNETEIGTEERPTAAEETAAMAMNNDGINSCFCFGVVHASSWSVFLPTRSLVEGAEKGGFKKQKPEESPAAAAVAAAPLTYR